MPNGARLVFVQLTRGQIALRHVAVSWSKQPARPPILFMYWKFDVTGPLLDFRSCFSKLARSIRLKLIGSACLHIVDASTLREVLRTRKLGLD
ncbi:uncharacterized protein RAG0_10195 [Rhynchosporium agropyri]|uniref:Uncharacterized protein n=1 Tax=Rhynchosporium agropyri TaxID=914238 RepID=A0A1E1KYW5_9HELO|nr:uncharacterized protein RAG0_10195 [Rhynchosporium agropyri]